MYNKIIIIQFAYVVCQTHNELRASRTPYNLLLDYDKFNNISILPSNNVLHMYIIESKSFQSVIYKPIYYYNWYHRNTILYFWREFFEKPSISHTRKQIISWYAYYYHEKLTNIFGTQIKSNLENITKEADWLFPNCDQIRKNFIHIFQKYLDKFEEELFNMLCSIPIQELSSDFTFWIEKLRIIYISIYKSLKRWCKVKGMVGYLFDAYGFLLTYFPVFGEDESLINISKMVAPVMVRNWINSTKYISPHYCFCTDSVFKQQNLKFTLIPYLIFYIYHNYPQIIYQTDISNEYLLSISYQQIIIDDELFQKKFIIKCNGFKYSITNLHFTVNILYLCT